MTRVAMSFRRLRPSGWASGREAAPFGIREAKATTAELGFEHAVFRKEIRDDLLLMTLQPASNHGNQNMQDHRRS